MSVSKSSHTESEEHDDDDYDAEWWWWWRYEIDISQCDLACGWPSLSLPENFVAAATVGRDFGFESPCHRGMCSILPLSAVAVAKSNFDFGRTESEGSGKTLKDFIHSLRERERKNEKETKPLKFQELNFTYSHTKTYFDRHQ